MNLALTVAEIVAPAFLLAAVGYVWVRLGFDYPIAFITRIVMNVAIPCLIFSTLATTSISQSALASIAMAAAAGYICLSLISVIFVKLAGLDMRTFVSPLANGNTGNIGLPLAYFAFSDQGLGLALVVFAISGMFFFSFGVWVTSGSSSPARIIREPMIIATVLGAVCLWVGWQPPTVLTRTFDLAGQLAVPLMLITLGVAISNLNAGSLGQALVLTVAKLVISIGVAWAIGRLFGLTPVAFGVLVLQLSTPVAVTAYLIAEKYKADSRAVAGLVLVSTLLSVITLPLTLAFLV